VIVDSSAVVAILLREPGWEALLDRVAAAQPPPGIGTPTLVETGIVLAAHLGIPGKTLLARFIQESGMRRIDFLPRTLGRRRRCIPALRQGPAPGCAEFR
jgi:ribonuclease VapC